MLDPFIWLIILLNLMDAKYYNKKSQTFHREAHTPSKNALHLHVLKIRE